MLQHVTDAAPVSEVPAGQPPAVPSIRVPMSGRDPNEAHRAATPLELLFDLSFVVAVAQAANALHHALADGQVAYGLGMYFIVFFGVWWPERTDRRATSLHRLLSHAVNGIWPARHDRHGTVQT